MITDVAGGTRIAMTCQYRARYPTGVPRDLQPAIRTQGGRVAAVDGVLAGAVHRRVQARQVVPVSRDQISKFEVTWNGKALLTLPVS